MGKKEENQTARESSPIKEILKGAKPSRKALIMKRDYCGKYWLKFNWVAYHVDNEIGWKRGYNMFGSAFIGKVNIIDFVKYFVANASWKRKSDLDRVSVSTASDLQKKSSDVYFIPR